MNKQEISKLQIDLSKVNAIGQKYFDLFDKHIPADISGNILIYDISNADCIVNIIRKNTLAKYFVYGNKFVNDAVACINETWDITFLDETFDLYNIDMKFDCIVMNPPYSRNLHLKILEETIKYLKDEGKCICLHPGMWIQFPYRKRKPTFLQGKIDNIEICLKNDISKIFDGCFANDLIITTLKSKNGKKIEDFNCFAMNGRFTKHATVINNIFKKICNKVKINEFDNHIVELPKSQYPLRIKYGIPLTDFNPNGGSSKFKIVSENYEKIACSTHQAGHTAYIEFNTDIERHNCWKAGLLLFSKFCIALNESMTYLPWLGDAINPRTGLKGYEGEWTDEDLYKFFNITADEQKIIEETMPKYK